MSPLEKWDESQFDRSFDINFKGPFFLIQVLLSVFNNPASIVLMTSINAHIGMPGSSVYGATKGALLSLSRTLSGELISRGIRVNAISGGPIATPLYRKLGWEKKNSNRSKARFRPGVSASPQKSRKLWCTLPRTIPHLPWVASWL
jgi:NAD(P)-dependent dehydrogenase (short-subunit alcohol dehydrogenase family)